VVSDRQEVRSLPKMIRNAIKNSASMNPVVRTRKHNCRPIETADALSTAMFRALADDGKMTAFRLSRCGLKHGPPPD
jgi:hypothetical protein